MTHRLVDTYFEGIPVAFIEKYAQWFVIWAKEMHNWGPVARFPLHNGYGRVLVDVPELDEHGNPPFIVVTLKCDFEASHMVIRPASSHDCDLIDRHCAALRVNPRTAA